MDEETPKNRSANVQIIHALLWAFAMIAAAFLWKDKPGSDQIVIWMVAGFVATGGLVAGACRKTKSDY